MIRDKLWKTIKIYSLSMSFMTSNLLYYGHVLHPQIFTMNVRYSRFRFRDVDIWRAFIALNKQIDYFRVSLTVLSFTCIHYRRITGNFVTHLHVLLLSTIFSCQRNVQSNMGYWSCERHQMFPYDELSIYWMKPEPA